MMYGRLVTALCALMVALAAGGPVATHARIAPEGGLLGKQAGVGGAGQDDGYLVAADGAVQDDFQTARALLGARKLPCAPS